MAVKYNVGDINKYNEMKMSDGTWKYVGKQGVNHPSVRHLFVKELNIPKHLRTKSEVINGVILLSKPLLEKSVEVNKAYMIELAKKSGYIREWTTEDTEIVETETIIKLVEALGKYIRKEDVLESVDLQNSTQGIEGNIIIQREGKSFLINTKSIYAEGSIQKLHVRYLIKTELPTLLESNSKELLEDLVQITSNQQKLKRERVSLQLHRDDLLKAETTLELMKKVLDKDSYRVEVQQLITKQYPFNPEAFKGKDLPGCVHETQETYNTWVNRVVEEEIKKGELDYKKSYNDVNSYRFLIKSQEEKIQRLLVLLQ